MAIHTLSILFNRIQIRPVPRQVCVCDDDLICEIGEALSPYQCCDEAQM
jgi:hypothetical protein